MDTAAVMSSIINNIKAMPYIDWFVTITALTYVLLAARENISCWYFGIASCTAWAYSSFVNYQLYLDAILQGFYVVMSFIGIYQWKLGAKNKNSLSISTMDKKFHLKVLIGGTIAGFLYGYLFDEYTSAEATYLDALTTIFAMITTFLVVKKKLENWLYWIVINSVYLYLYASRGAYLFTFIMVIYIIIAISGYLKWKQSYITSQISTA